MCKQLYIPCLNTLCNGFAQRLNFVPCENRPNCEVEYIQIPRNRRSTERYCIPCRQLSKRDRINLRKKTLYAERKEAAKVQDSIANSTKMSTPSGVERKAESSAMGESRGASSGGLIVDSHIPFSTPGETPESFPLSEENRFLPPNDETILPDQVPLREENRFLRSTNDPFWQNPRRSELISDSDDSTIEAPASGEDIPTNSYSGFAQGSQEISPGAADLASNDDPQFGDSSLAHTSRQTSQYETSADATRGFVPNQPNFSSTPQLEDQQPAPLTPMLTEDINPLNAGLDPTQNVNSPMSAPLSFNQTDTDLVPLQPFNQPLPQYPAYPPALPHLTTNPALEMELFYHNALDPIGGLQEAENLLREQGVWPEPPDVEKES